MLRVISYSRVLQALQFLLLPTRQFSHRPIQVSARVLPRWHTRAQFFCGRALQGAPAALIEV